MRGRTELKKESVLEDVRIAVNICTYHRTDYINRNISKLLESKFFDSNDINYYGKLHIFVIDNGCELNCYDGELLHVLHNRNTGGSGGFQRGVEEIRSCNTFFSHVVFMDDDVEFELDAFYILYDFLRRIPQQYAKHPVAGRMLCMDKPDVQYTAAEIWNGGDLRHIEYMRKITPDNYTYGNVIYDSGADYGGWWFCCFPMDFVRENDIMPFFIHCDDVEYGLRCGKSPIIIEGVHVWHETFDKRQTPIMLYYDTRNPLFVNSIHFPFSDAERILRNWKETITFYHVKEDFVSEYYVIRAMIDYLKGIKWLKKINSEAYHKRLLRMKGNKYKNALAWRIAEKRFKRKYGI